MRAAAFLVLAAPASPALGAGFMLSLSAPPAVVGKPMIIEATGTIPPEDLQYSLWFSLSAIPIPVGATPTAPGSLLLCGSTDDGETHTLAGVSQLVNIQPASSTPPSTGRRATIPEDARAGIRSCRRLPSERRRTRCLRAVGRVAARE